jgi:glycine betaine catabolism A
LLEKSLPSSYYSSPEIFARERELIFSPEWFCAAREEDISTPGDTLVLDVAGESILATRTKTGELKAHFNVCRHRGSRLCTPQQDARWNVKLPGGITSAGTIRCPYHQWTYSLDGQLLSAPFLNETEGFSKADFSLYPVHLQTWGGFIFLNLTQGVPEKNLRQQLGTGSERLARYPLQELRTGHEIIYDVAANWKLILENYNECYHCGGVHPELCEVVPDFKRAGGFSLDWERGIPHRAGAYTFTKSGTTARAPFPGLNEDEKVRHKGELFYPNLMCSVSCDHVAAFSLWPLAPDRTRIVCRFLFHPSEMAKADFDLSDAVEFWDLVNRQDWAICERVQLGVQTRIHKFGYFGHMENPSLDIRRYVRERLGEERS